MAAFAPRAGLRRGFSRLSDRVGDVLIGDVRLSDQDLGTAWLAEDRQIAWSADLEGSLGALIGSAWTLRSNPFGTNSVNTVTYGAGLFVAVCGAGTIATSTDGETWTTRASPFGTSDIFGVVYGAGTFVAVGDGSSIATSSDGITWTKRASNLPNGVLRTVAYGAGVFVVLGSSGYIATSPDGIIWTRRTDTFAGSGIGGTAAIYGAGIFVAVGQDGTGNFIATSPDGVTWTIRLRPGDRYLGVTYGAGLFVAVGTVGIIATSPNGITWTNRSGGSAVSIFAVTYGATFFVAVSARGDILSSTDGIVWTQQSNPFGTSDAYGVTFANGLYVAVAKDGKIAAVPAFLKGLTAVKPSAKRSFKAYTRISA